MNRKNLLRLSGYILFFLFLTLVFSLVNYPRENLINTVNRRLGEVSGHALSVEEVSFKPLISLKLGSISVDMGKERQILGDAVVKPLISSLLVGKKGVNIRLDGPWISSRFKIRSLGKGWILDVDSAAIKLGAISLLEELPLKLDGDAEAVLNLNISDLSNIRLSGEGQFTGSDIQAVNEILQPLGLSPLRFSSLSLFFTVQDNVVTLKENSLTGDVSANARGTIRFVPLEPGNSRLDLILDIKPGPEVGERLSPLFSHMGVKQRANGSVLLRIRGTIDQPRVTS